jgi:hypothetical protein
MLKWQMKTVLVTFFSTKGIVLFESIPQDQTLNQAHYVEILKQLLDPMHRKGHELRPNNWILHHDNAPANKLLSVKHFLAQKLITEMEHPPCYSDLAPDDLWLFPKVKSALEG